MASVLRVIKLVTNEEIIGVVQDGRDLVDDGDGLTADNLLFVTAPLKIVSKYDEKIGGHTIYLLDWIPAIKDDTVPIDKKRVLTLGTPNSDLEAHYYELVLIKELQQQDRKNAASVRKNDASPAKSKDTLKDTDFDDEDMN